MRCGESMQDGGQALLGWSTNTTVAPGVVSAVFLKSFLVYPGRLGHPSSARVTVALQVRAEIAADCSRGCSCQLEALAALG